MKPVLPALLALCLAALACSTTTPAAPSATYPPTLSPTPLTDLWWLKLGDVKSDQAWGVALDPAGNIYLAAFEQKTGQWFTDMAIYKFASDGSQLWRSEWGGDFQEKAFIIAVEGDRVYAAGNTHSGMGPIEADMALLALDAETGRVEWEFTWGQGHGYEEVDGLAVEGESIYISGWTTSAGGNYDAAILKLDRQGNKLWERVWGTEGFDSCDGQMVLTADSIYISGKLNGTSVISGGQAYVARFSKDDGEYRQHYAYGSPVDSDGLGMTSDGEELYVVGIDFIPGEGNQVLVLKLNPDLKVLWERHWGEDGGEYISRSAAVNDQGELIVAVTQRVPNSAPADITLVFYSPQGDLLHTSTWGGADEEIVHGIAVQGAHAYLAGEIKYVDAPQNDLLLIVADAHSGAFPPP